MQKKLGIPTSKPENKKMFFPNQNNFFGFLFPWVNAFGKIENKDKQEVHFGFICDGCGMKPIVGKRYKCKGCHNFDYCEQCFEKNKNIHKHEFQVLEKSIFKLIASSLVNWQIKHTFFLSFSLSSVLPLKAAKESTMIPKIKLVIISTIII